MASDNAQIGQPFSRAEVSVFNGTSWSTRQDIDNDGPIDELSCVAGGFCAASIAGSGVIDDYRRGSWSSVDIGSDDLAAISCVSSSYCEASGFGGFVYQFNGTEWDNGSQVDTNKYGIVALSCATRWFCMGVDHSGNALEFNGRRWSGPHHIDPNAGMDSISCPTARFCLASDIDGNVIVFHNGSWAAPQKIDASRDNGLVVSCASPVLCVAVDDGGNAFIGRQLVS